MFEKWKQRREEEAKARAKAEFLAEVKRVKEKTDAMLDTALLVAIEEDVEKVCGAVKCCTNEEGGECNCEACPFCDDEECLSSITDMAFNIVGTIGAFNEIKRNAKVVENEKGGDWKDVETD